MKITIKDAKSREVFFENQFYPTMTEIEIPFSIGIRMSKVMSVDLSSEKQEYDPSLFKEHKVFAFTSDIDQVSGWGNATFNLMKYSKDYDISLAGKSFNIIDKDIYSMLHKSFNEKGAMVWHEQPKETWLHTVFPKNIAIVPFETTKIPASWVPKINKFDGLIVPCAQNKEAFADSGVTVPIEIARWGLPEGKYPKLERNNKYFTFGTHGALSDRKGTNVLIDAFRRAFPAPLFPDVRLICKTSYNFYPYMVKDDRIIVKMTPISHDELLEEYFKQIDVGVYPTRGEGFGLCPLEALGTGVPVIITGWSGVMEYYDPKCCLKLDYDMVHADSFEKHIYKEDCGDWANPKIDDLVEKMKWCYEHQDEVKKMGDYGADYVNKEWLWNTKIKEFHNCLEKLL